MNQYFYDLSLHFIRLFILFMAVMVGTDEIERFAKKQLNCLANKDYLCCLLALDIKKTQVEQYFRFYCYYLQERINYPTYVLLEFLHQNLYRFAKHTKYRPLQPLHFLLKEHILNNLLPNFHGFLSPLSNPSRYRVIYPNRRKLLLT